jgi:hypothetical protein
MTIKSLYPTVRPTLNLDFADTRLLDPRITFSRASTGTFVGSNRLIQAAASGVPRFDHNPTTGESLGLLMEEARTNLLTASEATDASPWGLASATAVANNGVAPDGTTTADKIISTGGGNFRVGVGIANATAYTYSVFLKHVAGTGVISSVGFEQFGSTPLAGNSTFNLLTGTVVSNGASVQSSSITSHPNNWFRVSITATSTDVTATVINYASASGNEFLVWGAQLEAGSFATSYIPTTSSTATRAADVASMTGTNFSSWYNALQGAIYVEFSATTTGANDTGGNAFPFVYLIDSAGAINSAHFCLLSKGYGPGVTYGVDVSGSTQASATFATSLGDLTVKKIAMGYQENNFGFVLNAGVVQTDTSGTVPLTPDRLFIGSQFTGNVFTGTIKRFIYFPVRPSNASLQAITTP